MNDKIYFYGQYSSTVQPCPHCIWVEDDKKIKDIYGWKQMFPIDIIYPSENIPDFIGVTVFDSRGKFHNTFNCVNGIKGMNPYVKHNSVRVSSLLKGATFVIETLNNQGARNIRLLINSKVSERLSNEKEHPHALITVEDEDFFSRNDGSNEVVDSPYTGDTVVELDNDQCAKLVRIESNEEYEKFISDIFTPVLGRKFNPEKDNYFIFLKFKFDPSINLGIITGKISTDLKPK